MFLIFLRFQYLCLESKVCCMSGGQALLSFLMCGAQRLMVRFVSSFKALATAAIDGCWCIKILKWLPALVRFVPGTGLLELGQIISSCFMHMLSNSNRGVSHSLSAEKKKPTVPYCCTVSLGSWSPALASPVHLLGT